MNESNTVITRYAPSPTGYLNLGSVKAAIPGFLYAKKMKGIFYLRIEDTDPVRSKKEFEEDILEGFKWLGIEGAGPLVRQSERTEIYRRYIEKMIAEGYAYKSIEEGAGDGKRDSVIRFKNPNKVVAFEDVLRGTIEVDTTDLGDFVIARSETEPLYHLAVVIDDHEMGVTHIIRGSDGISNTPRQILIQEAIGAKRPVYAHYAMVLGPDKQKLSKRHGARPLFEYRKDGYLPEALINYLALLGWHPSKSDQEIFTVDELAEAFELEGIQKSPAVFDTEKLKWVNREHIVRLPHSTFKAYVMDWLPEDMRILPQWSEERLERALETIRERVSTLKDIKDLSDSGELNYLFEQPNYSPESLKWKDAPLEEAESNLLEVAKIISELPDFYSAEEVKEVLWPLAEERGRGNVLWPLRYALSGLERSPDPFTISSILGKQETIIRIERALDTIRRHA